MTATKKIMKIKKDDGNVFETEVPKMYESFIKVGSKMPAGEVIEIKEVYKDEFIDMLKRI